MNCYYNLLKFSLINEKKFRLVTGWNDFMVEGDGEVQSQLTELILTSLSLTYPILKISDNLLDPKINTALQIHSHITSQFTLALNGSNTGFKGKDSMGWGVEHYNVLRGGGEVGDTPWEGDISVVDIILKYNTFSTLQKCLPVSSPRGDELTICLLHGNDDWEVKAEALFEGGLRWHGDFKSLKGRRLEWVVESCGFIGGGFWGSLFENFRVTEEDDDWEDCEVSGIKIIEKLLNKGVSPNYKPTPFSILQSQLPTSIPVIELLIREGGRIHQKEYPIIYERVEVKGMEKLWREGEVRWGEGFRVSDERRKTLPEPQTCTTCSTPFTLLSRSYLCNHTLKYYCSPCSSKKAVTSTSSIRVSDDAFRYLKAVDSRKCKEREEKVLREIESEEEALKIQKTRNNIEEGKSELFGGIKNAVKGLGDFLNLEDTLKPEPTKKDAYSAINAAGEARNRLRERGEKLNDLGEKSERLNEQSKMFEEMARELNKSSKGWF
ncbi:hypothetical protein TL16_g00068 [Triparma laevis f. inornata]|nr:hypothetical protein TL16_g00068 [Triparma laevis f. inornata]GMI07740.1 hypothetical protein TrLO_g11536 [Triparma laevis f. longispina]